MTERSVMALVADVLGLDEVDPADRLFDLGMSSLTVVQLLSRIRDDFEVELDIIEAFEAGTVAELASLVGAVETHVDARPPLVPVHPDEYVLTWFQERFWYDMKNVGYLSAHVTRSFMLTGEVDVEALRWTFEEVVRRQRNLQTRFPARDGLPTIVIDEDRPIDFTCLECPDDEARDVVRSIMIDPFDIENGPLYRFALVTTGPRSHQLLMNVHELVSDGWSLDVLTREVNDLYTARVTGGAPPPELAVQYGDFAAWQRASGSVDRDELLAFWNEQLAAAPLTLAFPLDGGGVPTPQKEQQTACLHIDLAVDFAREVRELCDARAMSPFMVYLAAYAVLLHRYTGVDDIVINSPVANRSRSELEPIVGLFAVGNLPFRVDLSGDPSFTELLDRVRETARAAFAHAEVPVEIVGAALARGLPPGIVRQTAPRFRYRVPDQELTLPGLESEPFQAIGDQEHLALWIDDRRRDGIRMTVAFDAKQFDRRFVERLVVHADRVLVSAVRNPDLSLSQLPVLLEQELLPVSAPALEPASDALPDLVEETAARCPGSIAVRSATGELTYAALIARARRLAHHLRDHGVRAGQPVSLDLTPSPETIVGMLGILMAGGAIAAGVTDLRVLTGLAIPADGPEIGWHDVASPADPAFVLPERVAHLAVADNARWQRDRYSLGPGDVVAHVAADGPAWMWALSVWPALVAGATVAIPSATGERALAWVRANDVSVVSLPVSLATEVVEDPPDTVRVIALWGTWPTGAELPVPEHPRVVAHHPVAECGGIGMFADAVESMLRPVFSPAPGIALSVVDRAGNVVPPGAPGELCVVSNPEVIRTGLLARVSDDGGVHEIGRIDDELLLRGYRLTEVAACIEMVLTAHSDVAQAAVGIVGVPPSLTAYVRFEPGSSVDFETLADWLAAQELAFGPTAWEAVDAIPTRPDGSIDRTSLAAQASHREEALVV